MAKALKTTWGVADREKGARKKEKTTAVTRSFYIVNFGDFRVSGEEKKRIGDFC